MRQGVFLVTQCLSEADRGVFTGEGGIELGEGGTKLLRHTQSDGSYQS